MITQPVRNLGSVRSYIDNQGRVQEKLVTGLGPNSSFSDQLQSCMKEIIEQSRVKSQMCEESGNWFPDFIIPPADSHSSYQYVIGTIETTLNNLKYIKLPKNPHEVTNFRNAYQEIIITATPKVTSNIETDLKNKQNRIVTIQIGIKFKYKVNRKMYDKALIKFIDNTLILNDDINTTMIRKFKLKDDENDKKSKTVYGYFSSVNPSEEIKDNLQQLFQGSNINIKDDGTTNMKSYGFSKFIISGGFADCQNLGYLINASVDTVIYRAKPFTNLGAGYEMRKQQVEMFTKLLKLKIDDESTPTDPKWLSTHDIYRWCDQIAIDLVKEWIKEPYQLNGPDPLIFELFKCATEEELTKRMLSSSDMGNKSIISQLLSRISKMKTIPNPSPMAKLSAYIKKIKEDALLNEIQFIPTEDLTMEYSWSLARVFFWCSKYLFRNTYSEDQNIANCSNYNTLMMMGPPGTGKSTVLTILKDFLDGMIVNRSTYQRPSIIFSSAIIYPEFNTAVLAQWPDIYKSKLEGAMQCVDVKYKDPLNILKNVPCIGDTNSELPVKDLKQIDLEAFNRRMYCVRFCYKFSQDKQPQFTYNQFIKTMIGFYATFPEIRQGIFKINLKDYDIDEQLLQKIGEQFKKTQWYQYYWKPNTYNNHLIHQYHKTETSILVNDEIKGTKFVPFPSQFREYTLKNPEVHKMLYHQDESKEQEVDDLDSYKVFDTEDEVEIIEALEIPEVQSNEKIVEQQNELKNIFTDEYYGTLVNSFLKHCGSMKNKEELQRQLNEYFKNIEKDQLPVTEEEADEVFSDEDYRREILMEIKEFSIATNSTSPQNKRDTKEQQKKIERIEKIEKEYQKNENGDYVNKTKVQPNKDKTTNKRSNRRR